VDLGLKNKIAMVAGASRGLGFAVASILAREGVMVSIASRNTSAIQSAKARLKEESRSEILACTADLTSAQAIERWRDDTVREFGGIDLLFVNSGGPPAGTFEAVSDAQWRDAVELMLFGSVRLVRCAIPSMKARGGGSILFSTSVSVKEPIDNLVLSNVVRATLPALAKTLARELARDGIRVNNLMPGRIDTDRVRELDETNAKKRGVSVEEQKEAMLRQIPMGRYGKPEEYARAAVFLLSPAASYITGATLQVDGGALKSVL
jgi:3-oxoacyl-[acyl-carrier protein] reductase